MKKRGRIEHWLFIVEAAVFFFRPFFLLYYTYQKGQKIYMQLYAGQEPGSQEQKASVCRYPG